MNETNQEILAQMEIIRRLLEFIANDQITRVLETLATTEARRQIWALLDGRNSTSDISEKLSVSMRTVQQFVKELEESNLVLTEKRGYPQRIINYIPRSWITNE